jgi:hypothetical protein
VLSGLNQSRIRYAITGAAAASYYGKPRTTVDVDFIVFVSEKDFPKFVAAMQEAGLRADRKRIQNQLKSGYTVISLQDTKSQYRADFIIQQGGRLERRVGSMLGMPAYYQTPEALILAKLRMIKATVSPQRRAQDRDDITAILTNNKVNTRKIRQRARRESTLQIFDENLGPDV